MKMNKKDLLNGVCLFFALIIGLALNNKEPIQKQNETVTTTITIEVESETNEVLNNNPNEETTNIVEPQIIINYIDKDVPINNSFKSYLGYNKITDTCSNQYKLQQFAYTNSNGLRMVENRICIALGSYYSHDVGQYVDVYMKNGEVLKCIVADCKNDAHTDKNNQQHFDGSVVEFIVDISIVENLLMTPYGCSGDISDISSEFEGEILFIRIYEERYNYNN
jgi:hypothetical protein